jgi:hypothetical protein
MVLMRMTDQDRGGTAAVERRRYDIVGAFRCVELPPGIEDEPLTRGVLDLNTRTADLVRAAVNR